MVRAIRDYFQELCERFGAGWNQFWFVPSNPRTLCVLRIGAGLLVLYWHASYTPDLIEWFGPQGLLPLETVQAVRIAGKSSLLDFARNPTDLWIIHALGAAVLACFTLGLFTRLANALTLVFFLSYVHRGPMINGQAEPILSMLLLYLLIAPAGAYLSLDRLWRRAQARQAGRPEEEPGPSVWATIATRLIQVHLAGFYLLMGLTKVGGETWWSGTALWWLIAHPESRWLNLTWLADYPYVWNLWTHAVVALELTFPVLIWNRLARPLLLALAVALYVPLALVTGLLLFFAALLVGNLAYIPPEALARTGTAATPPAPAPTGDRPDRAGT